MADLILWPGGWLLGDSRVGVSTHPLIMSGGDSTPDLACCCPDEGGLCCDFTPEEVPEFLTLTISSTCATINGFTCTLTFPVGMGIVPSRTACWTGEITSGLPDDCCQADVSLCCCEDGGVGENGDTCFSFCLALPGRNAQGCVLNLTEGKFPTSCSCDPFMMVFQGTITEVIEGTCTCCDPDETFTVTITE